MIVTGGSNGIGQATVSLLLEAGARVASLDVRESDTQPTESLMQIICDVASDAEVKVAVQKVVDKWHSIDVLCNVAGIVDKSGISSLVSCPTLSSSRACLKAQYLYLM